MDTTHTDPTPVTVDIQRALDAYVETALWSSHCNGTAEHDGCRGEDCDVSLDSLGYGSADIDPILLGSMRTELRDFVALCADGRPNVWDGIDPSVVGGDFWLTRNRHGAGFWDRGLGEVGDHLTYWAHTYGSATLYVADGTVYDA